MSGPDRGAVDGGAEDAGGVAADVALEDDLDVGGAADVEVVSDQGLEERPGAAGSIEHQGAGDLDLAHGDLPPVPGPLVGSGRRAAGGGASHRWANTSMVPGCSRSQISCSATGVIAGGESVGQLGEGDPGPGRLPLGPLVAVDPDLGRVREVRADLDERRAEIGIPQVEVVAGHPPVSLGEGELRRRRAGLPPVGGPHPLELLRHPDRRDLRPAGRPPPASGTGPSHRPCGRPWRT